MKRSGAMFVSAVALAMMLISGCGGNAEPAVKAGTENVSETASVSKEEAANEAAPETKADAQALKAAEIYDKIKASFELPEMYEADDEWLMNYYGIDASRLSDYVFAEADEVHADRVIILTVADEKDMPEVEKKLNAVLEQMNSPEMLDYLPDQADIITSAKISKNGNTLYLVISPDAKGIEEIIENGLQGK